MNEDTAAQPQVLFSADTSRGFTEWLAGQKASLAVPAPLDLG